MDSGTSQDTDTVLRDVSGWGRFPRHQTHVTRPRSIDDLKESLQSRPAIARGMGRAYGDSAISHNQTIDMRGFNRMLSFDPETGQLVAEAGVVLGDIIETFLPRGWFPPVTPGTKFVSLGGMIAADVHGKNHHVDGGFGNFVHWIDVMDAAGDIQRCSATENTTLFNCTLGGMGLTGVVVRAAFRLRKVETAYIRQHTVVGANLAETMDVFERMSDWQYSVAWIDCLASGSSLGRSLVMLGEHAASSDLTRAERDEPLQITKSRSLGIPLDAPAFLLNRWTMGVFNAAYYNLGRRKQGDTLIDWNSYFYPLDRVLHWNRLYGNKGFMQFQCVLPDASSRDGLGALLSRMAASGCGTFLSVLKKMGPEERAFSFPMEGYTLCLDFPVNSNTLALMNELDHITIEHGGRFYLAKDSRMSAETFQASEDRADAFRDERTSMGADRIFKSAQSERLGL